MLDQRITDRLEAEIEAVLGDWETDDQMRLLYRSNLREKLLRQAKAVAALRQEVVVDDGGRQATYDSPERECSSAI